MSQLMLLVPRTDYMHDDAHDLLDSILISAGFRDEGVVVFDERAFRRYWLDSQTEEDIPFREPANLPFGDAAMEIYCETTVADETQAKLASYGLNYDKMVKFGETTLWQYSLSHNHLPFLAMICKHGVKASRRIVEEQAFFKFTSRGYSHGCDLGDWFAAEWEADERIKDILNSL